MQRAIATAKRKNDRIDASKICGCLRCDSIFEFDSLAEDVFDLVEDRGAALGGFVFDFERGAELLDEFALLARELGGREHAQVIVQIAAAAAMRIRQAFSFDAKHRAALRAFGDLELLFPVQPGHRKLCTESGLRDADGDGAV